MSQFVFIFLGIIGFISCTNPDNAPKDPISVAKLDMDPPEEKTLLQPNEPATASKDLDPSKKSHEPASEALEGEESIDAPVNFKEKKDRYVVTANNLIIRKGAGKDHPVVGKLQKGQRVHVLKTQGEWSQIGANKWVYSRMLSASF